MARITDGEWQAIAAATTITASLSVLCALLTVLGYVLLPRLRSGATNLVIFIALAELISIPAYAVGRGGMRDGEHSALCQWQGVVQMMGNLAVVLTTACIATDLLLVIFLGFSIEQVNRLHARVYVPLCTILPTLVALAPLNVVDHATNTPFYGDATLWCWISMPFKAYRLYLFYIPLWLVFLFNFSVYITVGYHIWKLVRKTKTFTSPSRFQYKLSYMRNVSLYLLAFLLSWGPATVNRIYQLMYPGEEAFVLLLLQSIFVPANGVFNCLVYMYTSLWSGRRSLWNGRRELIGFSEDALWSHNSRLFVRPGMLFSGVNNAIQGYTHHRPVSRSGILTSTSRPEQRTYTRVNSFASPPSSPKLAQAGLSQDRPYSADGSEYDGSAFGDEAIKHQILSSPVLSNALYIDDDPSAPTAAHVRAPSSYGDGAQYAVPLIVITACDSRLDPVLNLDERQPSIPLSHRSVSASTMHTQSPVPSSSASIPNWQ